VICGLFNDNVSAAENCRMELKEKYYGIREDCSVINSYTWTSEISSCDISVRVVRKLAHLYRGVLKTSVRHPSEIFKAF